MSVLGNYKKKPECIFSIREEMEKGTIDGDYIYAVLDGSLFMKTAHANLLHKKMECALTLPTIPSRTTSTGSSTNWSSIMSMSSASASIPSRIRGSWVYLKDVTTREWETGGCCTAGNSMKWRGRESSSSPWYGLPAWCFKSVVEKFWVQRMSSLEEKPSIRSSLWWKRNLVIWHISVENLVL